MYIALGVFIVLCFRGRLEELRLFFENEAWELCPVRANFSIYSLKVSLILCKPKGNHRTYLDTPIELSLKCVKNQVMVIVFIAN